MERYLRSLHRPDAVALAVTLAVAGASAALSSAPAQAAPRARPAASAPAASDEDTVDRVPTTRPHNQQVTLNFVNADIEAVSRAIGAMLDRQMLVDPRVKGTITVYNDKPQALADAYRSYLAALRGLGFTVVESGGFLKVVPEADAKLQTGVVSVGVPSRAGDQVLTQIFHLNHENPNNLVPVLRPLITANNTINASPSNNSLVITDYADNLQRLGKIIAALDQPAGAEFDVIPLKNAIASDVVQTVQRLIEGGSGNAAAANAGGPNAATATSVVVEARSNSLIVRAANAARMAQARLVIEKLDQPVPSGGPAGNIWVVYLKNADATRLAEVLRAAMSPNGGAGGGGGGGGTSSSAAYGGGGPGGTSTSTSTLNSPTSTGTTAGGAGGAASAQTTTPVATAARPSTGGQIQADPATNSLIITAPEPQYRQMRTVIDQLDVRRSQVYVETLMVSVDATRMADFGFQWQGLFSAGSSFIGGGTNFTPPSGPNAGNSGDNILNLSLGAAGAQGSTTTTATGSLTLPSNGLNIGFVPKINGVYTLAALAHFLEQNSGANVLSTPNLVALDNEEAKIVVGQNIPLVTGSYTNTGTTSAGTVNPFQTVERQDVGITLRIKSQIGENGTVRMTIYEENSSVSASNSQITNKTSVETFVTVDDGAMIVLGGLMKDEYGDGESGVPVLSSIPVIGNLFKSQGRSRHKSNLMLFLRPIVLRDQSDSDRLTVNRYDAIRAQQESLTPAKSIVMRVNDAPVIPQLNPDTRIDPNAPVDPGTDSVPMMTPQPAAPLRATPVTPPARVFLPPANQPPPAQTPPAGSPPAPAQGQ